MSVDIPKGQNRERIKLKKCAFPNCNETFKGTGRSCYCLLHRAKKYRKIIDKDKIEAAESKRIKENPNITIHHNYNDATTIVRRCECCNIEYTINIIPKLYVYSKFCPEHRNEFKRKFFLYQKGILKEEDIIHKIKFNIDEYLIKDEISY